MFISFDDYYDIAEQNTFKDNLALNKIPYRTYINIKPPHKWYFEISDKYKPVFLRYEEASSTIIKYLSQTIIPIDPSDEKYLRRYPATPKAEYERFISPNVLKNAKDKDYAIIFRYKDVRQIKDISKTLGIKIYILGKMRGQNIGMCFSKMIKNYIFESYILVEKTSKSMYSSPGELEYELSNKMKFAKLTKKVRKYPYVEDGVYYPLNKTIKYPERLT